MGERYDAVVVGAGPNGLAAGVVLAMEGRSVCVVEAASTIGGGTRTAELTLPGFSHDICSAVHPFGGASPLFASLPLADAGLEWVHHEVLATQPLDDGRAGVLHRSLDATVEALGTDGPAYRRLLGPVVESWDDIVGHVLGPAVRLTRRPIRLAGFGLRAALPASVVAGRFPGDLGPALLAGNAAHSIVPLTRPFTTGVGLALMAAGHTTGWPIARGGSRSITDALARILVDHGGEIMTDRPVRSLTDLPPHAATLFDLVPRNVAAIAGKRLSNRERRAFRRFRHGPGVFKIDYALDGPVPWTNPESRRASTVHLGGQFAEIADAEAQVAGGHHPARPFVLVAQPTIADATRAPDGRHVLWAYCHVPHGSTVDQTAAIERQIERFAPGFGDLVAAKATRSPIELEATNPNLVGGDIAGGSLARHQVVFRPMVGLDPYRLANDMFICSSSTPPGAGVHGMCGYHAARSALRTVLR